MLEQENRFLSKINDLEENIKEISKIQLIFTGPYISHLWFIIWKSNDSD